MIYQNLNRTPLPYRIDIRHESLARHESPARRFVVPWIRCYTHTLQITGVYLTRICMHAYSVCVIRFACVHTYDVRVGCARALERT